MRRPSLIPAGTLGVAALLALLCAACRDDARPPTQARVMELELAGFLASQAAANLDREGRFRLPAPAAPSDLPIISPERALELGRAFMRTWGDTKHRGWALERGREVEASALQLSPRVFYAQTPYERMPEGHHPAYQRLYGPWYILHFISGTETAVVLAVSAYGTDLRIDGHGRVREPVKGGTYFLSLAASVSDGRFAPLTPEQAAAHAAQTTGARVASVPSLVLRGAGWHPATAQWKLALDRPVRVARRSRAGEAAAPEWAQELYVGPGGLLSIPAARQRQLTRVPVLTGKGSRGSPPPHAMVDVRHRGGMAPDLDEVTLVQEGA